MKEHTHVSTYTATRLGELHARVADLAETQSAVDLQTIVWIRHELTEIDEELGRLIA